MTTLREFFDAECPKHEHLTDSLCLRCRGNQAVEDVDDLTAANDHLGQELERLDGELELRVDQGNEYRDKVRRHVEKMREML